MEILQYLFSWIFRYMSHSFNVLGYEVSLFQIFVVGTILAAIGLFWSSLKN